MCVCVCVRVSASALCALPRTFLFIFINSSVLCWCSCSYNYIEKVYMRARRLSISTSTPSSTTIPMNEECVTYAAMYEIICFYVGSASAKCWKFIFHRFLMKVASFMRTDTLHHNKRLPFKFILHFASPPMRRSTDPPFFGRTLFYRDYYYLLMCRHQRKIEQHFAWRCGS